MTSLEYPKYHIRYYSSTDPLVLSSFLHIFDESIAWLTSRGLSSQWGSEPLKNDPVHVEKVKKIIDVRLASTPKDFARLRSLRVLSSAISPLSFFVQCTALVAESVTVPPPHPPVNVLGLCLYSPHRCHPEVIPAVSEPEYYIQFLATSRLDVSAKGLGKAFIAEVEDMARAKGVGLIRLDCYAGHESREEGLVKCYESLGFRKSGARLVYDESGWQGQVMEKRVGPGR
ncbi:MAG: hypothetical protein Q9200_002486 [Gallowayella weberi]